VPTPCTRPYPPVSASVLSYAGKKKEVKRTLHTVLFGFGRDWTSAWTCAAEDKRGLDVSGVLPLWEPVSVVVGVVVGEGVAAGSCLGVAGNSSNSSRVLSVGMGAGSSVGGEGSFGSFSTVRGWYSFSLSLAASGCGSMTPCCI
jgi:hypothetical protein